MAIGISTARLLLAVFLLGLWVAGTSAETTCGGDLENSGYDVESLAYQQSWFFHVDKENCIKEPEEADCKVYFSICHSLPSDICSGTSAVCMSIEEDSSDPVVSFDLGQIKGSTSMPQPSNETEGFIYIFPNGSNTVCTNGTQTILTFECDQSASWDYLDPNRNNITQYVTPSVGQVDPCLFEFNLKYSGACVKPIPLEPNDCEVPGYNIKPLKNMTWSGVPPPEQCFYPKDYEPVGLSCNLYFSFCQSLRAANCYNSVFCEMGSLPVIYAYSFGTYDPDLEKQAREGKNEFVIEYDGGTSTDDCPNGLIAVLTFVCNENANWLDLIDGNVTPYMNATKNEDLCQYDVVFQYDGACSSSSPAIVGWILMAIVIGIAFIYFITGAIVQYVRGRRGLELIPNLEFWKIFFLLVLEGCRFTLDIITCYQLRSSIPKSVGKRDYEDL